MPRHFASRPSGRRPRGSVFLCLAIGVLFQLLAQGTATAQSVSDVLRFLVTNQSVQTGSIARDEAAALTTSETISRALLATLSTIPVTTSSGAFVYRLNPALGTVERATANFGPFFVERALPAGHLQTSLGLSLQHVRFDSLDGRALRDGSLVTTANQLTGESAPFDVDRLALDIDADVATLYANVGFFNRFEAGMAAPLIDLRLDGTRTNVYRGTTFTQAVASAHTLGLADIVLRGKYAFILRGASGVAAAIDARLPTGRTEDLLGTGSASVRTLGVASIDRGTFAIHANGGWTFGGAAQEFTYGAAVGIAANPRVTITAEFVGRSVDGPGPLETVAAPHPTTPGVETLRLVAGDGQRHLLSVAPGVKWNVNGTFVFMATVTRSLTDDGLTGGFAPFVGFDYALGR